VITAERGEELTRLISEDLKARAYYLDFVKVYAQLSCRDNMGSICHPPNEADDEILCTDLWQALAEVERTAETVEAETVEIVKPELSIVAKTESVKLRREFSKLSIFAFIFSAAAMLFIMVLVMMTPVKLPVAVLTDSIGAEWTDRDSIERYEVLHPGLMSLQRGIAKITFEYGAEVLIEGPAEIELLSFEKMRLSYGRVFATVPEHAKGFTIETPNSTIIDLGTEFGVKVDSKGRTDVHMFRGKASLIPGMKGHTGVTQDLLPGDAKRVDISGNVRDMKINTKSFVRKLFSDKGIIWRGEDIDLADIVGGGDGFGSGSTGIAIHPITGNHHWIRANYIENYSTLPPKDTLTEVPSLAAVDCVFMPDGGNGPVEISTSGHQWNQCPDTTGLCHWGIGCNAPFLYSKTVGRYYPVIIGGVNYVIGDRRSINMCSNLGVTFDLDAIRKQIPHLSISRFSSICGISDNAPDDPKVDCFVLIDSKLVFQKKAMGILEIEEIDIGIDQSSRFLTLIVTESDNGVSGDWFAFAEPRLILQSIED
ncbi:MAG: NPCBM/NEW2 domain-containing protein, partial [Anaerohalosphaera sp.]|nr:NPCBM/NEW2 domain-containing protein [Anaerohalosphaera sp.]